MNNMLPNAQTLRENFEKSIVQLRLDRKYVEICEEIKNSLTERSLKGDRSKIIVEVPYRLHSLLMLDLCEAGLSFSVVYEQFEIRF